MKTIIMFLLAIIGCVLLPKGWPLMNLQMRSVSAQSGSDIPQLIGQLNPKIVDGVIKGPRGEVQTQVKQKLLILAQESPELRDKVIHALIDVLEDLSRHKKFTGYSAVWFCASDLLGELAAVEALDILVRHLDYNPGHTTLSLSMWPTVRAVIKIGEPAIPKLEEALFKAESSFTYRSNAAKALGMIGGNRAKEILERASSTETNEYVLREIANSLSYILRKTSEK